MPNRLNNPGDSKTFDFEPQSLLNSEGHIEHKKHKVGMESSRADSPHPSGLFVQRSQAVLLMFGVLLCKYVTL